MAKVLQIDSSIFGKNGNSSQLTAKFVGLNMQDKRDASKAKAEKEVSEAVKAYVATLSIGELS